MMKRMLKRLAAVFAVSAACVAAIPAAAQEPLKIGMVLEMSGGVRGFRHADDERRACLHEGARRHGRRPQGSS